MIKKVLRKILSFISQIIREICCRLIKINPKLIVFGAMDGQWYGDNSKYMFEYFLENRPNLKVVWITKNKKVFNKLKSENKPVVLNYTLKGIYTLYRSRIGFYTNSLLDIAFNINLVPSDYKLIALRHGRSVKRVRFARKAHAIPEIEKKQRIREGRLIHYAISTSDFISQIQEECLLIGASKHRVTGYPRNDFLLNPLPKSTAIFEKFVKDVTYDKIVLYAPSWRHGRNSTIFFPFNDFDTQDLVSFLKNNKILLLLRPHMGDLFVNSSVSRLLTALAKFSDVIKLATHREFSDVNTLLPFVDILISDYSALYHDFLLLDRPLMFIPYDYDEFKIQNGFLYDYYSNLPGPSISTFKEFKNYIKEILSGKDPYAKERRRLCDKIHTFKDNNSRKRVAELIDDIIT